MWGCLERYRPPPTPAGAKAEMGEMLVPTPFRFLPQWFWAGLTQRYKGVDGTAGCPTYEDGSDGSPKTDDGTAENEQTKIFINHNQRKIILDNKGLSWICEDDMIKVTSCGKSDISTSSSKLNL